MKRLVLLLAGICALWPVAARAQTSATGKLTASTADCITAPCVSIPIGSTIGAATISLSGTWSATVTFEAQLADGTWQAILMTPTSSATAASTATGNGGWQVNPGAYIGLRARPSAYASGTIVATVNSSNASARAGGGGGGGASGTVSGQANGVIPLATGTTAIGAQSHLDDGVTTVGTITSSEPFTANVSTSTDIATGAPVSRTLAASKTDTFNVRDNGALGTNAGTAIGTTYGASVSALATYTTSTGATPFSWATNPLYGLTFSMAVSANQATTATPLTFTETLTDGTWSATVALWQDPDHGNYLVTPGMAVTGSCIAANTTVSSVNRTAGNAGYGQVTLSQNTSTTCASTTVITFTLTNAQLQALTLDWLGIQTAVARAEAANSATGSKVDIPSGQYILNHPVLNPGGTFQGITFAGGGVGNTRLTWSSDLGTDFCGIIEPQRSTGGSASTYQDFFVAAPFASLTMGTFPNNMDGLCIGPNAKVDGFDANFFRAGLNLNGNHIFVRTTNIGNNGYGIYFSPYDNAGVGNMVFSDSNIVGNTVSSFASSATNTIDGATFSAVHTGFGPYGFYQEAKPSTVTVGRTFLTNSTFTNVFIEAIGNAWIYAPNDFYGTVTGDTFIGQGPTFSATYKIAASPVPALIDAAEFNNNVMINTNWAPYTSVASAVILSDGTCTGNTWINDINFVQGATASIPALSCGQGAQGNRFLGPSGEGEFYATFSNLASAFLPLTDLGGGTAQSYTNGTPFAGLAAAPASSFTYVGVITHAPQLSGVTKANSSDTFTAGQFVYPATGGLKAGTAGAGAIGTVFGTSGSGTATVAIRLDPMLGAAGASLSQPGAIRSTGLVASVSTATLCASSAGGCNTTGTYSVHIAMYQSGVACTTNTTGGVSFQLTWTDGNGTAHSAITIPLETNSSLVALTGTMLFNQTASGIGTVFGTGDFNIDTNGSIIQYATTYGNCSVTGTATYALSAAVTRLQ